MGSGLEAAAAPRVQERRVKIPLRGAWGAVFLKTRYHGLAVFLKTRYHSLFEDTLPRTRAAPLPRTLALPR